MGHVPGWEYPLPEIKGEVVKLSTGEILFRVSSSIK
jgi:hypothetical protein